MAQSWRLLGKIKPDVVFTRGGYISVPVAIAAWMRNISYITHDSDSTPSLANRIIALRASLHAVALDPSTYPYPKDKTIKVGVPINAEFKYVTDKDQQKFKEEIGFNKDDKVLCITGGGNGADILNQLVMGNILLWLRKYPDLKIVHIAGRTLAEEMTKTYDSLMDSGLRKRVIIKGFVNDLYRYSGAADLIIARGGATNLTEFAAQGKACVIIPAKSLIWNVRNVKALADKHAIVALSEDEAAQKNRLADTVINLLDDQKSREELKKNFIQYYVPDSAEKIAKLILNINK